MVLITTIFVIKTIEYSCKNHPRGSDDTTVQVQQVLSRVCVGARRRRRGRGGNKFANKKEDDFFKNDGFC